MALRTWLISPNPNYNEISSWYQSWKRILPPSLMELEAIKIQFRQALEMMNTAVSGGEIPSGAREEVAYLQANEREAQAARDYQVLFTGKSSL